MSLRPLPQKRHGQETGAYFGMLNYRKRPVLIEQIDADTRNKGTPATAEPFPFCVRRVVTGCAWGPSHTAPKVERAGRGERKVLVLASGGGPLQ